MPLPGEQPAESHFFYVPANMVRPNEFRKARPDSVNSVDEVPSSSIVSWANLLSDRYPYPPLCLTPSHSLSKNWTIFFVVVYLEFVFGEFFFLYNNYISAAIQFTAISIHTQKKSF